MNNQIQQTYARTTSSGSVTASKTLLNVKDMTMANTVQTIATPKPAVVFLRGLDARVARTKACLLYTSPSPRDVEESRMPSSA